MTVEEFDKLRDELNKKATDLLIKKGKDYTQGDLDKLRNFKETARRLGVSPFQVALVFLEKHVDALFSLGKRGALESEPPTGRFVDARNYIDLAYACWIEEQKESTTACLIFKTGTTVADGSNLEWL